MSKLTHKRVEEKLELKHWIFWPIVKLGELIIWLFKPRLILANRETAEYLMKYYGGIPVKPLKRKV